MADFLVNTSNQEIFGTQSGDFFEVRTALNNTLQGLEGNDLFSGSASNIIETRIQGGPGEDSIFLSSQGNVIDSFIGGGDGNDVISADGGTPSGFSSWVNSTVNGGGGNDSITLTADGVFGTGSRVNGNLGEDTIRLDASGFNHALVAGGGDNDRIRVSASASSDFATIAGGGGADLISAQFLSATGLVVEGDTIGDSEFFGNDTIIISAFADLGNARIGGGGGADSIILFVGDTASDITVGGGNGRDTITVYIESASGGRVNGGAASDQITLIGSANGNPGTYGTGFSVFGGGGNDTVSLTTAANFFGNIVGGEGADEFYLGMAFGAKIRYDSVADASTLSQMDYVSSDIGTGGGFETAFTISQDLIQAFAGDSVGGPVEVNSGFAEFTSDFTTNLTARVAELDSVMTGGEVASFTDGTNFYIFIQGGTAGDGTQNDIVIETDKRAVDFDILDGTAISVDY